MSTKKFSLREWWEDHGWIVISIILFLFLFFVVYFMATSGNTGCGCE